MDQFRFQPFIDSAASIAAEAGNISKRITNELVERSREAGFQPNIYDSSEERMSEIRQNLDSKFDKEKIDGLKRLIAVSGRDLRYVYSYNAKMISKGRNVAEFFPDVVKNVASTSFEVRKLVYIYLLKYAEYEPDLALLSINTFQKAVDLSDRNALIRAMALRVMSSIRVDPLLSLDPSQKDSLVEIIQTLLNDNSTIVLGTVIASMRQVCPERYDLLHKHFRKLCHVLIDADEWAQLEICEVLLRYARLNFVAPTSNATSNGAVAPKEDFFSDEATEKPSTKPTQLDPDHELLLTSDYVRSCNKQLVTKAMKLMGNLSSRLQTVAEDCLNVMMILISSSDEDIVAEAVVVVRRLLQLKPAGNKRLIVSLAKTLDSITVPMARASIIWLTGEYCELIPRVAPDALRKAVKTFPSEAPIVKLQIMNLGAKLLALYPEMEVVGQLFDYIINVGRYDSDYDVRDRARFLKALVSTQSEGTTLPLKRILLNQKVPQTTELPVSGRSRYLIGSLSHSLNVLARDYKPLPDWPAVAPDPSVRHVQEVPTNWSRDQAVVTTSVVKDIRRPAPQTRVKKPVDLDNFLASESEEEEEEEEVDEDDSGEDEDSDEDESVDEEDSDEEEDEDDDDDEAGEKGGSAQLNGRGLIDLH
ncbi:AP-3 complex subunit beta-1 [Cladochytrium tenue]|nr:AP-3 complex subunit beta-1 [Cladochytrium tenue]